MFCYSIYLLFSPVSHDSTNSQAEKLQNKLQEELSSKFDSKVEEFEHCFRNLSGKITWCYPNLTSDRYGVDSRLTSLSDLEDQVTDAQRRLGNVQDLTRQLGGYPGKDARSKTCAKHADAWKSFLNSYETIKQQLKDLSELWQEYDESVEAFTNWISNTEERVRKESFLQHSLTSTTDQLESLQVGEL